MDNCLNTLQLWEADDEGHSWLLSLSPSPGAPTTVISLDSRSYT